MVALLAGTRPLRSQDRPAAPPAPAPVRNYETDTLAAARDVIRELGVGREARNLPAADLPRFAIPEWHQGADPAPRVHPARPNPGAAPRNPNWLIDALQPPEVTRGPAEGGGGGRSVGPGARAAADHTGITRSRRDWAPTESRGAAERSPMDSGPPGAGTMTNPLTAYLDDWMTPQDFTLLNPGLLGRAVAAVPPPVPGPVTGGLTEGPQPPAGIYRGMNPGSVPPAGSGPGTVYENPFLAALNAPATGGMTAAPAPRLALPTPVSSVTAAPSLAPPPPPPPAPPARIPDFIRPTAEEKYFKPLKRF